MQLGCGWVEAARENDERVELTYLGIGWMAFREWRLIVPAFGKSMFNHCCMHGGWLGAHSACDLFILPQYPACSHKSSCSNSSDLKARCDIFWDMKQILKLKDSTFWWTSPIMNTNDSPCRYLSPNTVVSKTPAQSHADWQHSLMYCINPNLYRCIVQEVATLGFFEDNAIQALREMENQV